MIKFLWTGIIMVESIKDYWLGKLLFPKTYIINKPGVIISKTSSKYSNKEVKRRMIYNFEDIAAALQLEVIKNLGKGKADELFYKIGKDVAVRYMLLSKARKSPTFFLNSIINYLFNNLKGGGFSLAENINYDPKNKSLILRGRNNMICRKSKLSGFTAGLVSGFFSFLVGENVEAEARCYDCPNGCVVVANKKIKEKWIPNIQELKPLKNYGILNFSRPIINPQKYYSFNDLLNFGKVRVDSGKVLFMGKALIPTEAGCLELVADYLIKINRRDILEKGIIRSSAKLIRDILKNKETELDKINTVKIMLSAFGWGIVDCSLERNKIIFNFINSPITKYNSFYRTLVVNGYLNYIFNKKFKIKELQRYGKSNVRIQYSDS